MRPAASAPALPPDALSPAFLSPPTFSKLNRVFTAPAFLAAPPTDGARSASTASGLSPAVGAASLAQAEARDIARAEEAFRQALDERLTLWRERCLPFIGLLMTQTEKPAPSGSSSSLAPDSKAGGSSSSSDSEATVLPESLLAPYLVPSLSTFSVLSAAFLRQSDEKISALFFELCVAVASGGFSYSKATDFLVKKVLPHALFHFVLIAADLRRAAALTHAATTSSGTTAPLGPTGSVPAKPLSPATLEAGPAPGLGQRSSPKEDTDATPRGKEDSSCEGDTATGLGDASASSVASDGQHNSSGIAAKDGEEGDALAPEVVALEAALRRCFSKAPCSPEAVDIPASLEFIASTFFPQAAAARMETEVAKGGNTASPDAREKSQKTISVSGVLSCQASSVYLPACSLQSLLPLPFRALLLDAVTVTTEMCVHADPARVEFRRAQSNLGAFLRLLETGHLVTPVDICAFGSSIRLDDLAWPRLAPSVGGGRKRVHELLIKERTKRKFTLTVYNLCRENISFYARLHATLLAYVESPTRIPARICLKAVAGIVGEGSLCPSRTLATILSVYEDHLFSHNQLLPLVSLFSPEKLLEVLVFQLHLYTELRRQRDFLDEDAALTVSHANLSGTSSSSASASGSSQQASASPVEMGAVARRVQNRAAEGPSPNFYRMLALFVMKRIISLEALYPHLLPADALLSALFERTASRYQTALQDAKAGVLPAPPKPQLSVQAQFEQALPGVLAACGVGGDSGDTRRDGTPTNSGPGPNGPAGANPGAGPGSAGGPNMPHPPSSAPFGYYGRLPMHSPSAVNQGGPPGWVGSPSGVMGGPSFGGAPFSSMYGYPPPLHQGSANSLSSRNPMSSNSPHFPPGPNGFLASGANFGASGAPAGQGPHSGGAGAPGGRANAERDREAREKIDKEKKSLEKKLVEKEKALRNKDAGNPLLALPGARQFLLYDEQGVRFALEKIYGIEIGKFQLLAAFFDFNGTVFAHQLLLHFTAKLHVNPCLNGAVQKSLARYINWLLGPLCARRPQDSLGLYLAKARSNSGAVPLQSEGDTLRALRPLCRDAQRCSPSLCAPEPYWLGAVLRREGEKAEAGEGEKECPFREASPGRETAGGDRVKHEREESESATAGENRGEAKPMKRVKREREEDGGVVPEEADAGADAGRMRPGTVDATTGTGLGRETGKRGERDEARRKEEHGFVGLAPAETYDEFFLHVLPLLRYLGASLAFDTHLFSSVLSVLAGVAEEEQENRKRRHAGSEQPRRTQLDDVLVELVFPALSQVPCGASVLSAKVWGILERLPASRRYAIYTRVMDAWLSEESHPMTLNYEVVRVRLRKLLKRLTSTIFEDRLKAKERTLLSEISALSRIAPGPVADLFLHQTDLFDDNMVKTLAEAARSLAPLAADIFLSRFIHRQLSREAGDSSSAAAKGKGGLAGDVCGPPKQLVNRAALTGRFLKIHHTTDLQPLLVSTILRLWRDFDNSQVLSPLEAKDDQREGARRSGGVPRLVGENRNYPGDLLGFWRDKEYIEKLVELMGDCPKLPEAGALTADQIYAQGGGPLLKAEVMLAAEDDPSALPRNGEDEDSSLSTDRRGACPAALALRAALSKREIFTPLLFILAKQRVEVFYDGDYARSLRSFGSTFDDLQTYHLQLVDFLSRFVSPSKETYASLLPSVREIFGRFEPAMAWTILRPGLPDFLEGLPRDAPTSKAREETKGTARDRPPTEAALDTGDKEGKTKSSRDATKNNEVQLTHAWQASVRPTVEEYLAEKQLNGLSMDFFLLFWRLSLGDIFVPDRQYEACLARLDAGVKQSSKALEDLDKQRRSTARATEQQKRAEEPLKARLSRLQRRHEALHAEWQEHKRRFDAVRNALRSLQSLDWFGCLAPSSPASSPSAASPSSKKNARGAAAGETTEAGDGVSAFLLPSDEKENQEAANAKDASEERKGVAEAAKAEAEAAGSGRSAKAKGEATPEERDSDRELEEDVEMDDDLVESKPDAAPEAVFRAPSAGLSGVADGTRVAETLPATPCTRKGGPLAVQAFVKFLLAPRLLNAEVDALFCSHFVLLLLELKVPLFNYLAFTNVWTKMLTPLVRCSTVREAQLLGLFVNEMLAPLSRWLKNDKVFEKETGGNSCFGRTFRESASIPAAQLEKGAKKWESRIFESLVQGLPDPSATTASSASPSQWMAAKAVVVFLSRCHANFPLSYKRGVELMARLEHLVELAQAWGWKDVSLSASSILKTLDKYRRERTWYQSPAEVEKASTAAASASKAGASSALPAKGGAKNALSVSMAGANSHRHASSPPLAATKDGGSSGTGGAGSGDGKTGSASGTASPRSPAKSPSVSRDAAVSKTSPPGRGKSNSSSSSAASNSVSSTPRPKAPAATSSLGASRPNPRVPEPLKKAASASAGKAPDTETGVSSAGRSVSEGKGPAEGRSRDQSEETRKRETGNKGLPGPKREKGPQGDGERREEAKLARPTGEEATTARGKDCPGRRSRSRTNSPGDRESKRQRREEANESDKAQSESKGTRGRSASVSRREENKEPLRSEGAKCSRGSGLPSAAESSSAKKAGGKDTSSSDQTLASKGGAVTEKSEAGEERSNKSKREEREKEGAASLPLGPRHDGETTHKEDEAREKKGSAARKRRPQDDKEPTSTSGTSASENAGKHEKVGVSGGRDHGSLGPWRSPPRGKNGAGGEGGKAADEKPATKGDSTEPTGEAPEKKKPAPRLSVGASRVDHRGDTGSQKSGKKEETQRKLGGNHPSLSSASSRGGSGGSRGDRAGDAAAFGLSASKPHPKSGTSAPPPSTGPQSHHASSSGGPQNPLPGSGDRIGGDRGSSGRNMSFSGPRRSSSASGANQGGRPGGPGEGPVGAGGPPNSKWGASGPGGPGAGGSGHSHHGSSFSMPPPPSFSGHNHNSQHGGAMRNVNAYSGSQYSGGSHAFGPHNPQSSGGMQGQAMGMGGPSGPQARNALFGPSKGQHSHRAGGGSQSHHRSGHHQR
ncbi:transcription factor/nuclear export subunit 2 [Toxoplasma gondii GAB2-2007-GAL-DOM2]|nr:hypothetical protein TGGT1_270930 [Toxoplasma gondii GT1]KFG43595.1 transcription factor/nuclear export subunit 2 [Toxoplasma gondii GAB2-2007-GAL-DOM2]